MQKFLNDIKLNFPQYKQTVDNLYMKETLCWESLFSSEIPACQLPFYRGVFDVIRHFLDGDVKNSDAIPEQLFIQIPMEELGRTDTQRRINLNHLHEIIASVLLCSTSDSLRASTMCWGMSNARKGDFYYTKHATLSGCWEIMQSSQSSYGLRPRLIGRSYATSDAINKFENLSASTIKIKENPLNVDTAHGKTANTKNIEKCFEEVQKYSNASYSLNKQYHSARIIGYPDVWCNLSSIVGNDFIDSPVKMYRNLLLMQERTDILVLIGDRKYKNFERTINNEIASGRIQKVIYVGSSIYEGYDSDIRNVRYSFSFRELFTYFYGQYPEIKFHKIEFPWLFETLTQLKEILTQIGTYEEYHKSILTLVAYQLLGLSFTTIPNDFASKLKDRLLNEFGVSDEVLDNWLDHLNFNGGNPKIALKNQLLRNTQQALIVSDRKKTITEYLKKSNNKHTQKVLIDVRGDWKGYLEILESLLSQSIFGDYNILSYIELPKLQAFFEKETKVYNNPYRVNLLGGYPFRISTVLTKLADYFDANMLDSLLRQDNAPNIRSVTYRLQGVEGVISITGDVIYADNTKPLNEIMEEKEDIFPAELTYYIQPDNFEQLMELYFNLPKGENVAYFASLWKEKLRIYCDSKYAGNVKEMAKKDFPFMVRQLRPSYISKDNPIKFPECTIMLAREMYKRKILTEEEQNLLIAAHNLNKQNQGLGRLLKEALYAYRISGGVKKLPILDRIESNARVRGLDIDADRIVQSALKTDIFTDIIKEK